MRTETIRIESKDYEPVFWSTAVLYICEHFTNVVLFRYGNYASVRLEEILEKVVGDRPDPSVTLTLIDEWDDPYIVVRDEAYEEIGFIDIIQLLF